MEITEFNEYYKAISNSELLSIIDNPKGYQPLAIKAAKKEFEHRQLSDQEIQDARQPLIKIQLQKEKQKTQVKAIEEKVKTTGYVFLETLSPVQSELPTIERTIRVIVIVFSVIFLYQITSGFHDIIMYIKDIPRFPLTSAWVLFPIIFLPISIYTFWKRKSIGWVLLTIYLTFSAVNIFLYLAESLNRRRSNFGNMDKFFPTPSPSSYIFHILFLTATIYILCKQNMRDKFSIKKETVYKAIIMTFTLTFLLHLFI